MVHEAFEVAPLDQLFNVILQVNAVLSVIDMIPMVPTIFVPISVLWGGLDGMRVTEVALLFFSYINTLEFGALRGVKLSLPWWRL